MIIQVELIDEMGDWLKQLCREQKVTVSAFIAEKLRPEWSASAQISGAHPQPSNRAPGVMEGILDANDTAPERP